MFETSGVLKPAIEAYLARDELTPAEVAAIRAYLRQWIDGPWQAAPGAEARVLERLRRMVDEFIERHAVHPVGREPNGRRQMRGPRKRPPPLPCRAEPRHAKPRQAMPCQTGPCPA
jgi:hypothetical protein